MASFSRLRRAPSHFKPLTDLGGLSSEGPALFTGPRQSRASPPWPELGNPQVDRAMSTKYSCTYFPFQGSPELVEISGITAPSRKVLHFGKKRLLEPNMNVRPATVRVARCTGFSPRFVLLPSTIIQPALQPRSKRSIDRRNLQLKLGTTEGTTAEGTCHWHLHRLPGSCWPDVAAMLCQHQLYKRQKPYTIYVAFPSLPGPPEAFGRREVVAPAGDMQCVCRTRTLTHKREVTAAENADLRLCLSRLVLRTILNLSDDLLLKLAQSSH